MPVSSTEMEEKTEIVLHWFSPKMGSMQNVAPAASVEGDVAVLPKGCRYMGKAVELPPPSRPR